MLFLPQKLCPAVLVWFILLHFIGKSVKSAEHLPPSDTFSSAEPNELPGYRDIALFRNKVIAVGTDGRIDCISQSGEIAPVDHSSTRKLNCVFANDDILIAGGDHGTILYGDGKCYNQAESGTDKNIYTLARKNGIIFAGTDQGLILNSKDGKAWSGIQTGATGNILSLTANDAFLIGVTDANEIIKSSDGLDWEIKDYNKEYQGYNQFCRFKKILAAQDNIVIIGIHADGSPTILSSTLGSVWAERMVYYHDDQEIVHFLTEKPNGIAYDSARDQFVIACDNGELLTLPACTKCNEYAKISEKNLHALVCVDSCLYIVGDEFSAFMQRL
jgi:ligand-binding sensor domain-containing protein